MNKAVVQEIENRYQNGQILKSQKEGEIQELIVDIRTIYRKLDILVKKGLLEHIDERYSLSSKALSDIRYFPQGFGDIALHHIALFPIKSVDQSLADFITRFGAYIVFTFIEAASPFINNISTSNRKQLLEKWLQTAIPIDKMFNLFLTLYKTENTEEELNQKTIEKLIDSLEKICPDIFKQLLKARQITLEEHKARKVTTNKYYIPGGNAWAYVVPKNWLSQIKAED